MLKGKCIYANFPLNYITAYKTYQLKYYKIVVTYVYYKNRKYMKKKIVIMFILCN